MVACQFVIVALICCSILLVPYSSAKKNKNRRSTKLDKTITCGFDDNELSMPMGTHRSPHSKSSWFVWTNGIIPYYFSGTVTSNDKALFRRAMGQIETRTCFRFEERRGEPTEHHLQIRVGSPSCSVSGFSAYVSARSLTKILLHSFYQLADQSFCNWEGGILHELMHALGVGHTQRRKDRDSFINVHEKNIIAKGLSQYRICSGCRVYDNVPYDCKSIMHYGYGTFRNGTQPTMTAIDPSTCVLTRSGPAFSGAREASGTDWKLLNIISAKVCSGAIDGKWSAWSTFSACSATCGNAIKTRSRTCSNPPPSNGGKPCSGLNEETVNCNLASCVEAIDGQWSAWNAFSPCSASCGATATKIRKRTCSNPPPSNGGKPCVGLNEEAVNCNHVSCEVKCTGTSSDWSCCTSSSPCQEGQGDCDRNSHCADSLVCGQNNCKNFNSLAHSAADCCIKQIEVKCTGTSSDWSCCTNSSPCQEGQGDCDRNSHCAGSLVCGRNNCKNFNPKASSAADCCIKPIVVNGEWSAWSRFSACSATCGTGTKTRKRTCSNPPPSKDGKPCPGLKEENVNCNLIQCSNCSGTSSDWSCCNSTSTCQEGEGDCDRDSDCAGSLICGKSNCKTFNHLAEYAADCCVKPLGCYESSQKQCPFDQYKKDSSFIQFLLENVFNTINNEVINNNTDVFTFIGDSSFNSGNQDSVKIQEFIFKLLVARFIESGKEYNYAFSPSTFSSRNCKNNICHLPASWYTGFNGSSKGDWLAGHGYSGGLGFWVPNYAKHHPKYCTNFPKIKNSANSLVILMRNSPARHYSRFPTPKTDPLHFVSDQRVLALGLDDAEEEDLEIAASEPSMALFFPERTEDQLKKDLKLLSSLWACVDKECCSSGTGTSRDQRRDQKEQVIFAVDPE